MKIKLCPACGNTMDAELDICPHCGIDGMIQAFESEEAYHHWEKSVLEPYKSRHNTGTQVFAGLNHALILRPNGDLYAIGNNRNGCCGENLPDELEKFTRIASHVSHAAAGMNHTVYVNWNGKVTILGRSEFVDRFTCDFPVKRVFAGSDRDEFLLEDMDGKLYFLGIRSEFCPIAESSYTARKLPKIKKRVCHVSKYNYNGHIYTLSLHSHVVDGHYCVEDYSEVQEILRSDWYRDLVRQHGAANIKISFGDPLNHNTFSFGDPLNHNTFDPGYSGYKECCIDYFYEPEISVTNQEIYRPELCPEGTRTGIGNCFLGCWPDMFISRTRYGMDENLENLQDARKVINNCGAYGDSERYLQARLAGNGELRFYNTWFYEREPTTIFHDITDCAVVPGKSTGPCSDMVLLVTKSDIVYVGTRESVANAAKIKKGWNRYKQHPPALAYLKWVRFPDEK